MKCVHGASGCETPTRCDFYGECLAGGEVYLPPLRRDPDTHEDTDINDNVKPEDLEDGELV